MGGKSGGKAYTPIEHPDNLQSAQVAEIIDLLGEGEIAQELDLKRIYLNDTPVQNADGTYNFKGVEVVANKGTRDQLPLEGFENTLRTVGVGARVKKAKPIVREITDPTVTSLILTLGVSALVSTTDKGDRLTTSVSMLVEFIKGGTTVYLEQVTFDGKTTSQYHADDVYENLPQVPFSIRVSRVDEDSTSERLQNDTYFAAYTEVINSNLSYPHSVVVGIKLDSAQFGNQIPTRKYLVKGMTISVPENYDPETRTYDGIWSGAFKPAWTNNPAWVFYDAVTNDRYGLGEKLNGFEVDKWALYQIAQYCDEMVDDGYGGKEPRMTCNLHITDERDGYEVLSDLASIFRGISMWTGSVLTVSNDRVTEPVAIYTNANVVDGTFSRSFVAKRAMTSVVHVSYLDKREMFRQKTEYVSDDELVKRYGENVKSVVAYGCTSRGQAARLGRWMLETAKRERQTITFTVGAEGLKHLPFDVIQVSDKYWADEMVGGRVVAVKGKTVTLDVEVKSAVGGTLIYMTQSGQKTLSIVGLSADKKTITVAETPTGLVSEAVWSMIPSTGVKPQLFRCLAIEENTEAGTYSVVAVAHDPDKDAMVDTGVKFTTGGRTSAYTMKPEVYNPTVEVNGKTMSFTFDSNVSGGNVEYEFTVYRDGKIVKSPVVQSSPKFNMSGLANGKYVVKVRAKGDYGYSNYLEYGFTVDYNITGLRAIPKTLAIDLVWNWPSMVVSNLAAQIWYAKVDDPNKATLLATVPHPQNTYTLSGVGVTDTYYFWARGVSETGEYGESTPSVRGRADKDPAPIVAQMQGAITKSALSQSLLEQLNSDMTEAAADAVAGEAQQRIRALKAEADARTKAIKAEQAARMAAVKAASDKAASDLLEKADQLGTRITTTENVNKTQARQIRTVTAAQGKTAAGLETEKKARADGIVAEAKKRETLAARVGNAEGAINEEKRVRAEANRVQAEKTSQLTSRIAGAESGITKLQKTVSDNEKARAEETKQLTARFDRMNVGGRNYLRGSVDAAKWWYYTKPKGDSVAVITDDYIAMTNAATSNYWKQLQQFGYAFRNRGINPALNELAIGDDVVINGYVKNTSTQSVTFHSILRYDVTSGSTSEGLTISQTVEANSDWTYFEIKRKVGGSLPKNYIGNRFILLCSDAFDGELSFKKLKVAKGTVASDWTPAPEDLETKAAATEAALTEFKSAQATKDTATTKKVNEAISKVGNAEAKLTQTQETLADTKGKVQSLYTLKAETLAGGRKAVSGLMMGADGQTADSQILLMADKVGFVQPHTSKIIPMMTVTRNGMALNGDLVADGTILGRHIAAKQTISAPIINGGKVSASSFLGGNINIGNGNFTVDSNGNMTAKNGRFEGTVRADRVEGVLVEGIEFKRRDLGVVHRHSGIKNKMPYKTIVAHSEYTFTKTDPREARLIFEPIFLDYEHGTTERSKISSSGVVYINGVIAPKSVAEYRGSNTFLGGRVHFAPGEGNRSLRSLNLPKGYCTIRILVAGVQVKQAYSFSTIDEIKDITRAPTDNIIDALLIYKYPSQLANAGIL
ncbi:host specificity protein J [Neisseria sp. N95_16]|uniref:DUF1983 domain-containing protein n=1 Tax=Neisseria brasiliensis TaxID=2666100 RepID=A0A7X2GZ22_9NEIS|nr:MULTISPECIES: phage tail protein [Neisseria]MRN38618.1 DUF1983 domain-containing protein [Neisseria brasiliensis]PJO10742.1 host specificity protein J [Neisseria sp. N95_16]